MHLEKEPIIQVGIQVNSIIEFELKGTFLCQGKTILPNKYKATLEGNSINTSFVHNNKIELHPSSPASTFILKKVCIGIGFHWEQNEDQEFEGGLCLQIEEGSIRVLNKVPLEKYLKSVISSEMSAMNDLNLLKAHAIVSRSWLLAQIEKKGVTQKCHSDDAEGEIPSHKEQIPRRSASPGMIPTNEIIKWYDREDHATFDVCADDHCQRYQGITKVISKNASKAIDETRGLVLIYKNEICDARFSKCCGGFSENFENVWQTTPIPYLQSIRDYSSDQVLVDPNYYTSAPDSYCNTSDPYVLKQVLIDFDRKTNNFYRWEVKLNQQKLTALLHKKTGIDFGPIAQLIPLERGPSGRIIRLNIIGEKHSLIVGKELEIRRLLSESHLYSAAFIVIPGIKDNHNIPKSFTLQGAGWGHGVGMCQIGAAVMSKKGFQFREILQHYFRNTSILNIFP